MHVPIIIPVNVEGSPRPAEPANPPPQRLRAKAQPNLATGPPTTYGPWRQQAQQQQLQDHAETPGDQLSALDRLLMVNPDQPSTTSEQQKLAQDADRLSQELEKSMVAAADASRKFEQSLQTGQQAQSPPWQQQSQAWQQQQASAWQPQSQALQQQAHLTLQQQSQAAHWQQQPQAQDWQSQAAHWQQQNDWQQNQTWQQQPAAWQAPQGTGASMAAPQESTASGSSQPSEPPVPMGAAELEKRFKEINQCFVTGMSLLTQLRHECSRLK